MAVIKSLPILNHSAVLVLFLLTLFYLTACGVKCHMAAIKILSILNRTAVYLFLFLWE